MTFFIGSSSGGGGGNITGNDVNDYIIYKMCTIDLNTCCRQ